MYEKNKANSNNGEIKNDTITEKMMRDTEKNLFNIYYQAIKDNIADLSSSYFYYLSRLYHNKIGNDGDKLLELICINKACEYNNDIPGLGSIMCFYRKSKSLKYKEEHKNDFEEEFKKIQYYGCEGYEDKNGVTCPVCYTNQRNTIALPCKHIFCDFCINKLNSKCAICRQSIIMEYPIK